MHVCQEESGQHSNQAIKVHKQKLRFIAIHAEKLHEYFSDSGFRLLSITVFSS